MFDNAELASGGRLKDDAVTGRSAASIDCVIDELRHGRLQVSLNKRSSRPFATGISLHVPVCRTMGCAVETQKLMSLLRLQLATRVPVSLSLGDLNTSGDAAAALQEFCETLKSALSNVTYDATDISLLMHSHQMSLRAFLLISNSVLGSGPRFVALDALQMKPQNIPEAQEETERNWRFLWQQRKSSEQLLPVYSGMVRSACPIASDEVAGTVLPNYGIVVPANSAWLPIDLPLNAYVDANRRIDWCKLSKAIRLCVRAGDQILNLLSWPCLQQSRDAELHRRLAITPKGLGDLTLLCGYDPKDNHCLEWLSSVIARIRKEVRAASIELAQDHGVSPALLRNDPSLRLSAGPARDDWQRHWKKALQTSALRHRNLLVMSPYSVLPANSDENIEFTDLMPVIGHADAWCFSATPGFAKWSLRDYQRFHRRAWAVVHAQNRGCVVAGEV